MKKGSALILSIVAAVAVIGLAFVLTSPIQSPTGGIPGSGQIIPSFKVAICHKGTTLFVAPGAVPGHQGHGDAIGPCGAFTPSPTDTLVPTPTSPEPTATQVGPTPTPTCVPFQGPCTDSTQCCNGASCEDGQCVTPSPTPTTPQQSPTSTPF